MLAFYMTLYSFLTASVCHNPPHPFSCHTFSFVSFFLDSSHPVFLLFLSFLFDVPSLSCSEAHLRANYQYLAEGKSKVGYEYNTLDRLIASLICRSRQTCKMAAGSSVTMARALTTYLIHATPER